MSLSLTGCADCAQSIDVCGWPREAGSASRGRERNSEGTVGSYRYRWAMADGRYTEITTQRRLDPYLSRSPRFLGVTDTNALLRSVDNDCRNGWRSRLLRLVDDGTAVLYAADHVYIEVYRRLPKIARSSPVPLEVLRAHFETEYLPALRFVTVSSVDVADSQILAITDPDDVPTGGLAKLIAPCVVFSYDRHLRKPGLAPPDWLAVAKSALDISEGSAAVAVIGNVALLPARGAVELVNLIARRTGISPWLLGGVALGAGVLLFKQGDRRESAMKYVGPFLDAFGEVLAEAKAQERRGLRGVGEVILPTPPAPSIRQQVAITLARQDAPLLAQEIHEVTRMHFPDAQVPTVGEIRSVLKEGAEFVQSGRYRWQFGRKAGARSGAIAEH